MQILGLRNWCSTRPDTGEWQEREERLGWDVKTQQKLRKQKPEGQQLSDTGEKILFAEEVCPRQSTLPPALCLLGE